MNGNDILKSVLYMTAVFLIAHAAYVIYYA